MGWRWIHTVLWTYADDVPVDKLSRHHRVARIVAYTWLTSSAFLVSTLVEFILQPPGWRQSVYLVVLMGTCAIAFLSAIPGILSIAWADEIEKTLRSRGCPLPRERLVNNRVPGLAMKMCFWFAVAVLCAHWFRKS